MEEKPLFVAKTEYMEEREKLIAYVTTSRMCLTEARMGEKPLARRSNLREPYDFCMHIFEIPKDEAADGFTLDAKLIRGGTAIFQKKLKVALEPGQLIRLYNRGEFIALGRADVAEGVPVIRQEKLFVLEPPNPPGSAKDKVKDKEKEPEDGEDDGSV